MKTGLFFKALDSVSEDFGLAFRTPDKKLVPAHFHVTEAAVVHKRFKDCGGTERNDSFASIQLWVAHDTDHRIKAGKLRKIILDNILSGEDDLELVVEYENDTVCLYNVDGAEQCGGSLVFQLAKRKTDCLAPDRCGVSPEPSKCCPSGCCG